MPQVAFTTLGCKVNQFETDTIEGLFQSGGYEVVPFTARADVYVINTCSVTQLGEKKSRQLIRRAAKPVTRSARGLANHKALRVKPLDEFQNGSPFRADCPKLIAHRGRWNRHHQ